jgi:hypothetical protein
VGQLEARDLARSFHCPFIECSAADGVNVDAAFKELVKLVRRKRRREEKVSSELGVRGARCVCELMCSASPSPPSASLRGL